MLNQQDIDKEGFIENKLKLHKFKNDNSLI